MWYVIRISFKCHKQGHRIACHELAEQCHSIAINNNLMKYIILYIFICHCWIDTNCRIYPLYFLKFDINWHVGCSSTKCSGRSVFWIWLLCFYLFVIYYCICIYTCVHISIYTVYSCVNCNECIYQFQNSVLYFCSINSYNVYITVMPTLKNRKSRKRICGCSNHNRYLSFSSYV